MPNFKSVAKIQATLSIELTETEAAALDALAGYGDDAFIEQFYKGLGRAYLEPYEAGLRSLLQGVRGGAVAQFLNQARDARAVFTGAKVATYKSPQRIEQPPGDAPTGGSDAPTQIEGKEGRSE